MGIETKLFIETEKKDVFTILIAVQDTLNNLIFPELIKDTIKDRFDKVNNSFPTFDIDPKGGHVSVRFKYKGEARKLFICFVCDCDHHEASKLPKVSFLLGAWGQSELYMSTLRDHFTTLGYTTYYKAFDGENTKWEQK